MHRKSAVGVSRVLKQLVLLLLLLPLACAPWTPGYETPQVALSSLRILPGETVVPTFEITLQVINPNRVPLKLQGLSYAVELEGHSVLKGVASQLPRIEAYSEGQVVLLARPDLISTLGLFSELVQRPRERFSVSLKAALDVGSLWPKLRLQENRTLSLTPGTE